MFELYLEALGVWHNDSTEDNWKECERLFWIWHVYSN